MPRDIMITAIDLRNCLQRGTSEPNGLFIVTNFNNLDIAFHVDSVVGIHRVSWSEIIKPNATVSNSEEGISTGVIKINDKLIIILDFERIVTDISPETGLKVEEVTALGVLPERADYPILIAEDSLLLNRLIVDSLKTAGYNQLIITNNGQEAWDIISDCVRRGDLDTHIKAVITDIEMPLMDGHRLTKLIKDGDETKDIPVVIFSSLVNEEMMKKGNALGADAQISKPEIGKLVRIMDGLLLK